MRGIRAGDPIARTCKRCGVLFDQYSVKPALFCGYECRIAHNQDARKIRRQRASRARLPEQVDCPVCGKRFPSSGKQYYCSVACNKKSWKLRNRNRHLADTRLVQDRSKFDGHYIPALARDHGKCIKCGAEAFTVHHLDNRGDKCKILPVNHSLANLVSLCDSCHRREHTINWAYDGEALIIQCEAFRPLLGTATVRVLRREALI